MLLAQIMKLYVVPVLETVLTDLPEHTCRHCTTGAAILDPALGDSLAHFDHCALLGTLDFAATANTDTVVPGFLDGDEVDFAFELAVDVV
jgi:hypothetical protein